MSRQICQKTICSSLAQVNLVRNETGSCWGLEMDVWEGVFMAKGVSVPRGAEAMSTHTSVRTPLRDCSYMGDPCCCRNNLEGLQL